MEIIDISEEPKKNIEVKTSRDGYLFKPEDDLWQLNKNTRIRLKTIRSILNPDIYDGFIKTLTYYAIHKAAATTHIVAETFLNLLRVSGDREITTTTLINYKASLTRETEWALGSLRPFFYRWKLFNFAGSSQEVVDLLKSWRIKGSIKGEVVKKLDPRRGPLTDIELLGFNESVIQGFEKGLITIEQLCLAMIVSSTGRRPVQISHLKIKDLFKGVNNKGETVHILNTPRAKQRNQTFRNAFRQFAIQNELKVIIEAHANITTENILKKLRFPIPESIIKEFPLFADLEAFENIETIQELESKLNSDRLHVMSTWITNSLKILTTHLNIYSERTGELLEINTYRFRYTIGTRAAREGFGVMVIAELLDHTDIQNASIYVENIPDFAEVISKAVGQQLAKHAQAFAGKLIYDESEATRGKDKSSRIKMDANGLGNCGTYGFCGANVPIPCYTCLHFQAWIDGPHELVLEGLQKERNRLYEVTGDLKLASINDRSILAVIDVIKRCEIKRRSLDG